jgi:hypothetical protein
LTGTKKIARSAYQGKGKKSRGNACCGVRWIDFTILMLAILVFVII